MLGLLVIIVISGFLLYVFEKENIHVLGVFPVREKTTQFLIGFGVIMLISLVNILIEKFVLKVEWQLASFDYRTILSALWYHFKSALTEDLVFRGAILYILIKRLSANKAIVMSAIVFGVYHWFSYGIIGERVILLAYVFLITGFTGYVWAFTFYKTKSIMLGLGFHLGVNFINACFFTSQPYGELLFQVVSKVNLQDWNWLWFHLFKGLFPSVATLIFVKQYLKILSYNSPKQNTSKS